MEETQLSGKINGLGFEVYRKVSVRRLRYILKTVKRFYKQEGITDGDMATAEDFGDYY